MKEGATINSLKKECKIQFILIYLFIYLVFILGHTCCLSVNSQRHKVRAGVGLIFRPGLLCLRLAHFSSKHIILQIYKIMALRCKSACTLQPRYLQRIVLEHHF